MYHHLIYGKEGALGQYYISMKVGKYQQSLGSVIGEKKAALIADLLYLYFYPEKENDKYINFPGQSTAKLAEEIIPKYTFNEKIRQKIKKLKQEIQVKETVIIDVEVEEIIKSLRE